MVKSTVMEYVNDWFVKVLNHMYMNGSTLKDAIDYQNDRNIVYDPAVSDTWNELTDVAVIGGNPNITLSEIFR